MNHPSYLPYLISDLYVLPLLLYTIACLFLYFGEKKSFRLSAGKNTNGFGEFVCEGFDIFCPFKEKNIFVQLSCDI